MLRKEHFLYGGNPPPQAPPSATKTGPAPSPFPTPPVTPRGARPDCSFAHERAKAGFTHALTRTPQRPDRAASAMAARRLKRSAATAAEDAATMDGKVRASSSSEVAPAKRARVSDRDAIAAAGALANHALLTTDRLHQLLGPGWTAVILEACCVRAKDQRAYLPADKKKLKIGVKDYKSPPRTRYRQSIMEDAARGSLSLVKWLRGRGVRFGKGTCTEAARGGHLDVVKYLHENGCPWDEKTCEMAAQRGDLAMLKYLHENGCRWDEKTCKSAAKGGHLDVLKYAHAKGCKYTPKYAKDATMCSLAAEGGNLAVLKYLRKNGCEWDEETCEMAAKSNHLAMLKYLHENGCPWDEKTSYEATRGGHLAVLKYAHKKDCPLDNWCVIPAHTIPSRQPN